MLRTLSSSGVWPVAAARARLRSLSAAAREFATAFRGRLADRRFWIIQAMVAGVTAFHGSLEIFEQATARELGNSYVVLMYGVYLLPIVYASLNFGREGAIPTAVWSAMLTVPNIVLMHQGTDRLVEAAQHLTMIALAIVIATRVDREVAARKQAQAEGEARRISELKYRGLFDSAGEAILVFDSNATIQEANAAAAALFGRSIGQVRGMTLTQLLGPAGAESVLAAASNTAGQPGHCPEAPGRQ